jgi:hypothetical protein
MNSAPYAPTPYAGSPPSGAQAPDVRKLAQSPAIRSWLKSNIYERTATVDEIETDLAMLFALRARGSARSPLYLLALLGSLGLGVFAAYALRNPPESPAAIAAGVVGAIVIGVLWSREPSFEPRRVELVIGLLGRLALAPGVPVGVRLDLSPLDSGRKRTASRNEGGWSVDYHIDEWLAIEGTLVGGVGFRYTRNEQRRTAVNVEYRGRTTITRTRTQGWFDDGYRLRYPPERFPRAAALGNDALKGLKFPEGFEPKDFTNQPGTLNLLIGSDRKWDAGPPGMRLDGGDGVKIAGLWLSILYEFLGAPENPIDLDGPGRPRRSLSAPAIDADTVKDLVLHPATAGLALGLPALLMILSAIHNFQVSANRDDEADSYDRRAKSSKDAKVKQEYQRMAKMARESSEERMIRGGILVGVGVVTLAAAGAGVALTLRRRKKIQAAEAAEAATPAAAQLLPPGAMPQQPPNAWQPQQGAPSQQPQPNSWQPQQGAPSQQPQPNWQPQQPPSGWRPPGSQG